MIPPNGASMGDAARTREEEDPRRDWLKACIESAASEAGDLAVKARKERDP